MAGVTAVRLDRKVRIERRTVGRDAHGGEEETFDLLAVRSVWIVFGSGQERREAAQERATQAATVRMRRCSITATLTPADRLAFDPARQSTSAVDAPRWDIVSVAPMGRDAIEVAVVRSDD